MPFPQWRTRSWSDKIAALDPQADCERIFNILFDHVFPLEIFIGTEIGQLRTFTIPTISGILHATGQYEHDSVKRLDDTKGIVVELHQKGVGSPHGQAMAAHLNRIHSYYNITNDDYLYTLSVFIFDPILLIERYGWRPMTPHEREATYHYYVKTGQAMNIQHIPPSYDAYWQWRLDYEARAQRYAESNTQVALGLVRGLEQLMPTVVRSVILPAVNALLEPTFRTSLGFAEPPAWVGALVNAVMRVRQWQERYFTIWDHTNFRDTPLYTTYKTYPNGYNPFALGPTKLLKHMQEHPTHGLTLPNPPQHEASTG
ncbi:MAG: oxygenase MpaB family protein [Phototrophicaceae bacterium]